MDRFENAVEAISSVSRPDQFPELLQRIAQTYGMKTVAYLGTGPVIQAAARGEPYILVTYPQEWVERYRSRGYLEIDPAIQVGLRRLLPIDWDDFSRHDGDLRRFFGEAVEYGLGKRGISFPVHGYQGDRCLFSLTADVGNREWEWMRRTALRQFPVIAAHLHEAVLRVEGGAGQVRPRLSRREIECLQWTSEGKTVWECGVILNLSPHTVRCYLESARHKLSASSNTHAVSVAMKLGLLFKVP